MKACPFCAEHVQDAAIVCKHCGRSIGPVVNTSPAALTDIDTGGPMTFRNPANGYTVTVNNCGAWCLLFGIFYFAKHGVWTHALIGVGAAIVTAGISWLVYPFFARKVIRQSYLSRGWVLAPPVVAGQ